MEKYEKLKKIGEGAHAKVYTALHKATGWIVALKKSRFENTEEGIPTSAFCEISLLLQLPRSIYIVRLLDKKGKSFLYLVFEHLDCDLAFYVPAVHRSRALPWDLKPQNILLDIKRGILKIADFGLGRAFTTASQKNFTPEIGSLWYSAPEILMGLTDYSSAVDMWSVGCIFAEISRREVLFPGESELQQLLCIFRLLGTPQLKPQSLANAVPALKPLGVDLYRKCYSVIRLKRISLTRHYSIPTLLPLRLEKILVPFSAPVGWPAQLRFVGMNKST